MNNGHVNQVTLEQLATELFPDKVVSSIDDIDISDLKIKQQESVGSTALRFIAVQGEFIFEVRLHLPIKKTLALLAGLSGLVWGITHSETFKLMYVMLAIFIGERPTL